MATYYVGPGGNDGNSGLTWALRKLTLNGAEDIPVAAGDIVYVGPGVYREQLTVDVSGGNLYTVGTVSVTFGSATVTGAGTLWLANVAADYMFHIAIIASGNDGVANGTATFTSAAGNFQANMVGKAISINARAPYRIGAVAAPNSITLTDPHGVGWPAAGGGLIYSVMSGEGSYDIASVDSNTQLTLTRPWHGLTLTGLNYRTYNPIRYIADVTGQNTDGIGGHVRITGSDNDQTATRARCIESTAAIRRYRVFRGFCMDTTTSAMMDFQLADGTIEDCYFQDSYSISFRVQGRFSDRVTIRRCIFWFQRRFNISCLMVDFAAGHDDTGHVFENCIWMIGADSEGCQIYRLGGLTFRNCYMASGNYGINQAFAPTVGQTSVVENSIFTMIETAIRSLAVNITEDYNNFYANSADRAGIGAGANSINYCVLLEPPFMFSGQEGISGYRFPWRAFALSQWSQIGAITGANEPAEDLFGIARPVTAAKNSWGPVQFRPMARDTATVFAGAASMEISDAGRVQFKVPCTNRAYMVRVRVQRENNYAGVNPQIVIKQPGQADRTTTDAGAAATWNLLEDTFTPAALPEYFFVELVSNNTAVVGNYATYFDDLEIRGEPQNPGEFEHWLWDRRPFGILPANALVVSGQEYRRRRLPAEVSAMREQ